MSGNPGDIDIFSSNHNNMANERAQESMEDVLLEIFDDTNVLRDQIDHLDECLASMLDIETSSSIPDDVHVYSTDSTTTGLEHDSILLDDVETHVTINEVLGVPGADFQLPDIGVLAPFLSSYCNLKTFILLTL